MLSGLETTAEVYVAGKAIGEGSSLLMTTLAHSIESEYSERDALKRYVNNKIITMFDNDHNPHKNVLVEQINNVKTAILNMHSQGKISYQDARESLRDLKTYVSAIRNPAAVNLDRAHAAFDNRMNPYIASSKLLSTALQGLKYAGLVFIFVGLPFHVWVLGHSLFSLATLTGATQYAELGLAYGAFKGLLFSRDKIKTGDIKNAVASYKEHQQNNLVLGF